MANGSLEIIKISSHFVSECGFRLDATRYAAASQAAEDFINKSSKSNVLLGDISRIFCPAVSRRQYVERNYGVPFYSFSDCLELSPSDYPFISKSFDDIESFRVDSKWILTPRVGTIGQIVFTNESFKEVCVSDNVLRVVIDHKPTPEYLFCYLSSPIGLSLIIKNSAGTVQSLITEDNLRKIVVPLFSESIEKKITECIGEANTLRTSANFLLGNAENLVYNFNNLPSLNKNDAAWFDPDRNIESVLISSSEVLHNNRSGSEYRLDAHSYNPLAQLTIRNIKQSKCAVKTIDDVTERVFMCNRFKRNYVDEKYGVPFLSGKNIIQIRPTDLKHISLSETTDLDDLKLEATWSLITRSGTIGRTCFVWKNYEDYTATEHIVRVVPNKEQIDPGYLYAFMSSQYGKQQVLRFTHGSVIDEVTDKQIKKVLIPLPSETEQKKIGDLVRTAYEKRAEAIRLEDEAQKILMDALTQ
jgi:type I restriction enzyme S subunit